MNEKFIDINQTLADIRADCEHQVRVANERVVTAEIEAQLCKEHLARAQADRDLYMRIAERLVTQFSVVEKVFAEAKAFALTIPKAGVPVVEETIIDPVQWTDEQIEKNQMETDQHDR